MTVPPSFRRRKELPKVLCLHRGVLKDADVEERRGYIVTTPLKTIIDCISEGTVADNFIVQAIHQALKRGLVLEKDLKVVKQIESAIYQKIKRAMNDNDI